MTTHGADKLLIDKPAIIVGRKGSCGALNICLEPSWPTDVSYFIIPPAEIDLKFAYIHDFRLNQIFYEPKYYIFIY